MAAPAAADCAALAAAPLAKGSARPSIPSSPNTLLFVTTASCPYAQRTWLALNEAGVSYVPTFVDLQNKAEWHLELNPYGRVPTVAWAAGGGNGDGGNGAPVQSLYESLVCNEYVNDLSEGALLPRSGGAAAAAGARLFIDLFGQKFGAAFGGLMFAEDGSERAEEAAGKVKEALAWLESNTAAAGEEGGGAGASAGGATPKPLFLLGQDQGAFTLADAAIYPFVARLVGVMPRLSPKTAAPFADLGALGYPKVAAWLARTGARPGVKATEVAPGGAALGASSAGSSSYWDYLEETYVAYRARMRQAAAAK
jgi:glutathione S-transferase